MPMMKKQPRDKQLVVWAKQVYKKFDYVCQVCFITDAQFHAHHLYSKGTHPELIYELDNGTCLCAACHINFHNVFGNKTTPSDFELFKYQQQSFSLTGPVAIRAMNQLKNALAAGVVVKPSVRKVRRKKKRRRA